MARLQWRQQKPPFRINTYRYKNRRSGVFYCMKYEIAEMLKTGGGTIVNMASILGQVGFASAPAYVAAAWGSWVNQRRGA